MSAGIKYLPQIIEKLKQVNPYKIILFGSHANGTAYKDSDIDILVVTSDNFMPKNYDEKMKINLEVSGLISEIKAKYPVDLIVHTLPMHKKFIALGSMFSKEINKKGKILYERS
ncbi:hypothetical protein ES708_23812 [subsurface metagenome]